ncbi:hypothetical protein C2E23DRAFT_884944 [Lenzites betulinus]|nr:hypothetical protein C2E23DRAFT_884944 [Lenzites betulinus]
MLEAAVVDCIRLFQEVKVVEDEVIMVRPFFSLPHLLAELLIAICLIFAFFPDADMPPLLDLMQLKDTLRAESAGLLFVALNMRCTLCVMQRQAACFSRLRMCS